MTAIGNKYAVPPFPYEGGKRHRASEIWDKLGAPDVYAEPFAGGLAVLLQAPRPARSEIVCDTSPHVANFWRALQRVPDEVARWADYPTVHHDHHARHVWLDKWGLDHDEDVFQDADFYDAKAAGWWAWGKSQWIGGPYAASWSLPSHKRIETIPYLVGRSGGRGVTATRNDAHVKPPLDIMPHCPANQGMQTGRGGKPVVSVVDEGVEYKGVGTGVRLQPWLRWLANRLSRVIVLRRDWSSAVTKVVLQMDEPATRSIAVLLDPPYRAGNRHAMYGSDVDGSSDDVAEAAYAWAVEHGADKRFRIAYCCHAGDFELPEGWLSSEIDFTGIRRADRRAERKDVVMFSPHCVGQVSLFDAP